jgi:tagatose-1,6-bisphosphate aldolase
MNNIIVLIFECEIIYGIKMVMECKRILKLYSKKTYIWKWEMFKCEKHNKHKFMIYFKTDKEQKKSGYNSMIKRFKNLCKEKSIFKYVGYESFC